jgi:hypothetical protein
VDLNLEDDYEYFDGTVSGILRSRQSDGRSFTTQAVNGALRRAVTKTDRIAAGGALVSERETVWHLPVENLGDFTPKVSDVWQDNLGIRWAIKQVEVHTLTSRYRCSCVREV